MCHKKRKTERTRFDGGHCRTATADGGEDLSDALIIISLIQIDSEGKHGDISACRGI
jgi:hypothetical protein